MCWHLHTLCSICARICSRGSGCPGQCGPNDQWHCPRPAHCLLSPHYVMTGEMWEQCCGDTTPLENSNNVSWEQLPGSINKTSTHEGSEEWGYHIVLVLTRQYNNPSWERWGEAAAALTPLQLTQLITWYKWGSHSPGPEHTFTSDILSTHVMYNV